MDTPYQQIDKAAEAAIDAAAAEGLIIDLSDTSPLKNGDTLHIDTEGHARVTPCAGHAAASEDALDAA